MAMKFADVRFSNPIACDQVVRFIGEAAAADPSAAIVDPYADPSSRELFEHLDEMLETMDTPEMPVKGRTLCSMVEQGSPLLGTSTDTWVVRERSQGEPFWFKLAVTSLLDDNDESLLNHLAHVISCSEYAAIRLSSKQIASLLDPAHQLNGLLRQHLVGLVFSSDMANGACWLLSMFEPSNLKTPELQNHGLSLQRLPILPMSDLWAILDTPIMPRKGPISNEAKELIKFFKLMPCFTGNIQGISRRGLPVMISVVHDDIINRIATWSDRQLRKPRVIDVAGPDFETEIQKMAQENRKELCKDAHSRDDSIRSKDRKAGMVSAVGVVLHACFGTVTGFEAKDPRRQTIHENVEFRYYKDMEDLLNMPSCPERDRMLEKAPWAKWLVDNGWTIKVQQLDKIAGEYRIFEGKVQAFKKRDRQKNTKTKSLDGKIVFMHQRGAKVTIWITSKHTEEEGGSQDNQMADLKQTLASASEMPSSNGELVAAAVNGNYYQRKGRIKELHEAAKHAPHVLVQPSKHLLPAIVDHLRGMVLSSRRQEAPMPDEPQTPA